MNHSNLLDHLYTPTLARLAAEIVADYAQPSGPNGRGLTFKTEDAFNAYRELVNAGHDRAGAEFFDLIEQYVAATDDLPDTKETNDGRTLYLLRNNNGPIRNAFGEPLYAAVPND